MSVCTLTFGKSVSAFGAASALLLMDRVADEGELEASAEKAPARGTISVRPASCCIVGDDGQRVRAARCWVLRRYDEAGRGR